MAESSKAPAVFQPWRDPNETPYVSIERVTKKFGEFVAVYELSLEIYRKELFCLLGASGCGKSTLLRMLAGFEQPSSGRILIDGVDMAGIPPYERPVNMMFQSYALFPHMNVAQNVAFGLKQEKTPRLGGAQACRGDAGAGQARRIRQTQTAPALGRPASAGRARAQPGQATQTAAARRTLAALDKKLREHTQFELMNIQEQVGVTFVVVTHDQQEAMTLSTRIGVMDEGELIQIGTPTDIYEFPQSRYVADFIGSVNIFAGKMIVDEPDHVVIHSEEAGMDIFVNHGVSAGPDADVWAAIRPEKMHISREDPAREQNCCAGSWMKSPTWGFSRPIWSSSNPARSCASPSRTCCGETRIASSGMSRSISTGMPPVRWW